MGGKKLSLYFSLFNEIGIISQLSRALIEARLPDGLSVSHFSILNHLVRLGDGRTPLKLARAFQVPKTTMTHTLSGLETHKLIEMRSNPDDGRSKCVWLTIKGRCFRNQAIRDLEPDLVKLAAKFPEKSVVSLVSVLAEIRTILDSNRDLTS